MKTRKKFKALIILAGVFLFIAWSCAKKSQSLPDTNLQEINSSNGQENLSVPDSIVVSETEVKLFWQPVTTQGVDAQYKIIYSTQDNIKTPKDAEKNGTIAIDWVAIPTGKSVKAENQSCSFLVQNLDPKKRYYFQILQKNNQGQIVSVKTITTLSYYERAPRTGCQSVYVLDKVENTFTIFKPLSYAFMKIVKYSQTNTNGIEIHRTFVAGDSIYKDINLTPEETNDYTAFFCKTEGNCPYIIKFKQVNVDFNSHLLDYNNYIDFLPEIKQVNFIPQSPTTQFQIFQSLNNTLPTNYYDKMININNNYGYQFLVSLNIPENGSYVTYKGIFLKESKILVEVYWTNLPDNMPPNITSNHATSINNKTANPGINISFNIFDDSTITKTVKINNQIVLQNNTKSENVFIPAVHFVSGNNQIVIEVTDAYGNSTYKTSSFYYDYDVTYSPISRFYKLFYQIILTRQSSNDELIKLCNNFNFCLDFNSSSYCKELELKYILSQDEYLSVYVRKKISELLEKNPDDVLINQWLSLFKTTRKHFELIKNLTLSNDFWLFSGSNETGFLNTLFLKLVNRMPTQNETSAIQVCSMFYDLNYCKTAIIDQVLNSDEFFKIEIKKLFLQILSRYPSFNEENIYLNLLKNRKDLNELMISILLTSEFWDKAQ